MKINKFNKINYSVFIGIFLGFLIFYLVTNNQKSKINFEDLALGPNNEKVISKLEGNNIHCHDLRDLSHCKDDYKNINEDIPVIMWLGNSQLHAINQYKKGDRTASYKLHGKLKELNKYVLTFSQPNANLQEHYLLFAHLINKFPIEVLILPVLFDDTREDLVRETIALAINDTSTKKKIKYSTTGKNLISQYYKNKDAVSGVHENNKTPQDKLENYIDKKFSIFWPSWRERENLKSQIFNKLYKLRNFVFRISASSTRKIIKGPYIKNQDAYLDILKLANKYKIEVLVYIPPLRNDVKIPYDKDEYENFKKRVKIIADNHNVNFISLEDIVPAELWGFNYSTNLKKNNEIDFMHFQYGGHQLLADAVYNELLKMINK